MSVFVKDINVPIDCDSCWHPNCSLWLQTDVGSRHPDCPIRPLPEKHERLVDADAFADEMRKRQDAAREWRLEAKDSFTAGRADAVLNFLCEVKLTLDKMPTIVEAEGDDG